MQRPQAGEKEPGLIPPCHAASLGDLRFLPALAWPPFRQLATIRLDFVIGTIQRELLNSSDSGSYSEWSPMTAERSGPWGHVETPGRLVGRPFWG